MLRGRDCRMPGRSRRESSLAVGCSNPRSPVTFHSSNRRILSMSSKRILVVMIAVLVALTASLSFAADQPAKAKKTAAPKAEKAEAAKEAEKAPRLTIVEPVKDYGTIAKGEKLDWSFLVKNTGDSDLQIIA